MIVSNPNQASVTNTDEDGTNRLATRKDDIGLTWKLSDHLGTTYATVDSGNLAVSKRRQDPYGLTRGTPPSTWPDKRGYQMTTGLTHLGARDYDAATGRFVGVVSEVVLRLLTGQLPVARVLDRPASRHPNAQTGTTGPCALMPNSRCSCRHLHMPRTTSGVPAPVSCPTRRARPPR